MGIPSLSLAEFKFGASIVLTGTLNAPDISDDLKYYCSTYRGIMALVEANLEQLNVANAGNSVYRNKAGSPMIGATTLVNLPALFA
jgi:hypothetical protein